MTATNYILQAIRDKANEGCKISNKNIQHIIEETALLAKDKESFTSLKLVLSKINSHKKVNLKLLTNREKEILYLIGLGKDSNTIAKQLKITVYTIETHRKNIRKKLKIKGKGTLFQLAFINNLLAINDDK